LINNSLHTYLFQVIEYNYNIVQSSPVGEVCEHEGEGDIRKHEGEGVVHDGEVNGLVDKPEQKRGSAEINYEIIDY